MDKYTVDLDKVLNDFEYRELTDDTSTALQRLKSSTPAKHTINNVFQSLNEYLNSDIKGSKTTIKLEEEGNDGNTSSSNNSSELEYNNENIEENVALIEHKESETPFEDKESETPFEGKESETPFEDKASETPFEDDENAIPLECEEDVNAIKPLENVTPCDVVIRSETPEIEAPQNAPIDCESNNVTDDIREVEEAPPPLEVLEELPKPIGFDNNLKVDEDELNTYLDAVELELGSEITEETVRPNSLLIVSPQIDLIGDPGSTPYNNMYKSAEKPPDSETSISASPTFSDVSSTGSNASTATTESVTDSIVGAAVDLNPGLSIDNKQVAGGPVEEKKDYSWLGKQAPLWVPDSEALNCLHCDIKFTVIKRRHHCRACGLVLCSKCCSMKFKLDYMEVEARVCLKCHDNLTASAVVPVTNQPNPNNPMEYCSTVPPLQQVTVADQNPPSVMVPVGVLKRTGSAKTKPNKSVMFCDGIRPGSELTNLDSDFDYAQSKKKGPSPPPTLKPNRNSTFLDASTNSFIPGSENGLPPTVTTFKSVVTYTECTNNETTFETLKTEQLVFAIQINLYVNVKIINMDCCINKSAWCFSTQGMITVGQDEIVLLLEVSADDKLVPKDVFVHLNNIFNEAKKGLSISENGISLHPTPNFLDSKNHTGFLYIRPSFQCLQNVIVPKEPYLIGLLIHKWEMPWAKIFPLRLILRLGAAYRYYPSPIISVRNRESVYVEIGHTIINLLADFRNYTYTLPNIRGLTIHMEGKSTTVTIPKNRYDQVMKSLNTSSDQTLAFGGNFSTTADSHLVCVQDLDGNNENSYTTHSISIQNRPRIITGINFIVFNGSLKSSSGLTAKSSLVEDGLMIQILPEQMLLIHECLRNMKNYAITCGCLNAESDETVNIVWGENDTNFNKGVVSSIDNQSLSGVPSIRVHNGKDYISSSGSRVVRWTEVFILQNGDENARGQEIDFSKLSESIAKASCQALVKYLDLLCSNNFYKIGVRSTLHVENVSYSAGSNGTKLPPIYMKSLDNELVQVLHHITANNNLGENPVILELIFHILNV